MIGKEIFKNLKRKYKKGNQFKILFCPYKESMWDSMQTIYESALEDDETMCAIMPIPYYTLVQLMPDKLLCEFEDEKHNFPDALNMTKWDCLLFQYPYDTHNSVTRPLLTSPVLKSFCKNLVLIPYAVIGNRDLTQDDFLHPCYKYTDLVVCEKGKHAVQLENYLKQFNIKCECVGWGSAKYDRLDKEYWLPYFPLEWREKTRGKEIVLLQTSIVPFLCNPEKIEQVEEIISEAQDNVCIWWRPHPLLEETIKALRPWKIDKYKELEKKVNKSRHILDKTEYLHRAIALTDRMISDKSSVILLYEHTGKPVTLLEDNYDTGNRSEG